MLKLFNTHEVADLLRVSEMHVRNMIKTGRLRGYKEGRKGGCRIKEEDVDQYIESRLGGE